MLSHPRIVCLLSLMVAGQLTAADQTIYITQKISFSNETDAPAGTVWEWNFGDDQMSKEKEPTHAYLKPGSYKVVLKVKPPNIDKAIPSDPIEVEVKDVNPKVEYTPKKIYIGQEVTFQTQYNADSGLKFEWDFEDGKKRDEANPKHRFIKSGNSTVKLKVIIPDGSTLSAPEVALNINPILVKVKGPVQTEVDAFASVKFENVTRGPTEKENWDWEWKILGPDGKPADDENRTDPKEMVYLFDKEGEYTVSLKAEVPEATGLVLPESNQISIKVASLFEPPDITGITIERTKIGENGDYTAQILVDTTGDYKQLEISLEGYTNPPFQKKDKANKKGRHIFEFTVEKPAESVSREPVSKDIVISAKIHPENPVGKPVEKPQTISLAVIPQQPGWILYVYISGGILVMAVISWLAIRTARS